MYDVVVAIFVTIKKMIKREASFQSIFNRWLRREFLQGRSGGWAFELKQTQRDYLPFSAVEEHQLDALLAASHGGLVHKISDETRGYKPFDCFALAGAEAFVVIRYPDFFCLIEVNEFEEEKLVSKRKSLTSERAKEIACEVVSL